MTDGTPKETQREPNPLFKEQKRTTIITKLRTIYGDENVEVSDEDQLVRCNSHLENGQNVSFCFDYSDIEDATETKEVIQLSQIYDIPHEKQKELHSLRWQSYLHLVNMHLITVSRIVVNDLDITPSLLQGNVKRIRLMVPDTDLSNYESFPEYPLTKKLLLQFLPNAFWTFDFPERQRATGDLDTRPVLDEAHLLGLLHEYGHGQEEDTIANYPLLIGLNPQQLTAISLSMENISKDQYSELQRQYAKYKYQSENNANVNLRTLLEENNIKQKLLPGEDADKRIEDFTNKQIAGYARFDI